MLALVTFVILGALIEVAVHAICQLRRKSSLHFSPAESAGHTGAVLPMIRVDRTYAQFVCFRSTWLASAFLEFPAVHSRSLSLVNVYSVIYIGLLRQKLEAEINGMEKDR